MSGKPKAKKAAASTLRRRKEGARKLFVRGYRGEDYPEVKALYLQEHLYGGQFDPMRDSAKKLQSAVDADPPSVLVCELGGKLVGTLSLIDDGRSAWLFRFAVKKGAIEAKAVKALHDHARAILRSRGHKVVLVYTPTDDARLQERYRSLGMAKGKAYTCFWQGL